MRVGERDGRPKGNRSLRGAKGSIGDSQRCLKRWITHIKVIQDDPRRTLACSTAGNQ